MSVEDDPVERALAERRARRADHRLRAGQADLVDRCRDAAERRLRVRAHVLGGATVAGTALGVHPWALVIGAAARERSGGVTRVTLDGLVRLSVGDLGPPAHRDAPARTDTAPASLASWLETIADRRGAARLWTRDGARLSGRILSAGPGLVGVDPADPEVRRPAGGGWTEWLSPDDVVACAEVT